jgi:hypothetical protein
MIGRCLRPQDGKTAVVLDHVGNTLRLGHYLDDYGWSLDGANKRERDAAPSVKICPVCFATSASVLQACKNCGHLFAVMEREVKVIDGELKELIARTRRREQSQATDLKSLRQLAQQRGYKRGWAERVYQARLAKRYGMA